MKGFPQMDAQKSKKNQTITAIKFKCDSVNPK